LLISPDEVLSVKGDAGAATLKNPRLLEILCDPDTPDGAALSVAGDELAGAGFRVPVTGGIPDFVTFAPPARRTIALNVPATARPDRGVLTEPRAAGSVPSYFTEASWKYPIIEQHRKGFLLDVGCGQGHRELYEPLGYDYVGLDVSFNSLQGYGGDADIDVVADCHRLPIRSGTVEIVNSTAVFEHLYSPPLAAREICRILKEGGLLIGSCSFLEGEHFDSQCHYSHLGLYRMLTDAGLAVRHIFPGESLWEMHSGELYFSAPFNKALGRIHRQLFAFVTRFVGSETPESRLRRNAAILCFIAEKAGDSV
jgi:SAM-dependent methyltransferase